MSQVTPERGTVAIPDGVVKELRDSSWGEKTFGMDVLRKYAPLIVAAELERVRELVSRRGQAALDRRKASNAQVALRASGEAVGMTKVVNDIDIRIGQLRGEA